MRIPRRFFGIALGTGLLFAGAGYAGAAPLDSHAHRQEVNARNEIRRGELMEQEGQRLERIGQFKRGQAMVRRGETLERHGQRMLADAERHEHTYGYR
jgi:hypothetical protein